MGATSHRTFWRLANRPLFRRRAASANTLGVSTPLAALIDTAQQCIRDCKANDAPYEAARQRWLAGGRADAAFDALSDNTQRLEKRLYAAEDAINAYPVATLPDLVAMLDHMESQGTAGDSDCVAALAAGIRRVAGRHA